MNQEDFAIVVGISNYPGLGETPGEANLEAPDRDAEMVYNWLASESGGALPAANIDSIRSSKFPVAALAIDAEPATATIEKCFQRYVARAERNAAAGSGLRVGRRLYVYVSGHGFSPKRYEGALYTAPATRSAPQNVYISSWIESFQDTGYFDEFVLWMDCCMEREFTVTPQSIPVRLLGGMEAPGPTFIALAAPRPLKTVEREISADDGKVHGVFTWTLLQGLTGAAIDPRDGSITARSLGDYLYSAMKDYLNPKDLENSDIAQEPDVVRADNGLVFKSASDGFVLGGSKSLSAPRSIDLPEPSPMEVPIFPTEFEPGGSFNLLPVRSIERPTYQVKLSFPARAIGKLGRLWTGTEVTAIEIPTGEIELNLERGLYAIEVPDLHLRQAFEVTGSGGIAVKITETGDPAIAPPSDPAAFALQIDTRNPTTEIFVIDRFFALVARGIGTLTVELPLGIYKIKTRIGRRATERIVLLDRDRPQLDLKLPQLSSAAPLTGSSLTRENHTAAAKAMSRSVDKSIGSGGQLAVMARRYDDSDALQSSALPWQGIMILNPQGEVIADLEVDGRYERAQQPMMVCTLDLDPGCYYLRRRLADDRVIEQSAIVSPGWRTELFLLRSVSSGKLESSDSHRLSVLMHRLGKERQDDRDDLTIEAARMALADERHILTEQMKQLFLDKCDNPISGIIGAHLLLMEYDRPDNPKLESDLQLLDRAVIKLRHLVGNEHPDVEALSLRCLDPDLHSQHASKTPPMFALSWQLLVRASHQDPKLISLKLWEKVRAAVNFSAYFAWATDRGSRQFNKQQLATWIESLHQGCSSAAPATKGGAARKSPPLRAIEDKLFKNASEMTIPANALEKLWRERANE